jgi:hypothetical protein
MYIHAVVSTAFFVVLSILITLGSKGRAVADIACFAQPDRSAPQGEHWYYHFDREKNQKCWHLGPVAPVVYESPPPERAHSRSAGVTLNTVFAPLFRGIRNLFRQPMSHEAAVGEPRIVQSDATKPLTIDDIAQPQPEFPEERAEARRPSSLTPQKRKALSEEYLERGEPRRATSGNSAAAAPVRPQ